MQNLNEMHTMTLYGVTHQSLLCCCTLQLHEDLLGWAYTSRA